MKTKKSQTLENKIDDCNYRCDVHTSKIICQLNILKERVSLLEAIAREKKWWEFWK